MGRQPRLEPRALRCTPEQRQEVLAAFTEYVNDVEMPIIAEFLGDNDVALQYGVTKNNMYDWPEMREQLDRAFTKQETYIVRDGMNKRNAAFNMFLLKQQWIGYKDRIEQDITTDGEKVTFTNALPRPAKPGDKKK